MSDIIEKTSLPFDRLGVSSPAEVEDLFKQLRELANSEEENISTPEELQQFRIRWMGRKNSISTRVRNQWLKKAAPDLKKAMGQSFNMFFNVWVPDIQYQANQRLQQGGPAGAKTDALDLTLPGVAVRKGARHIITQTIAEITGIFERIGFTVVEGPEVETLYYNFEALHIPADHPAVDEMDSLYLETPPGAEQLLLRTHTSPMQIRTMEKQPPPVRIVVPGKVYRRDNPDATHSFMFHQVEGLAVDRDITFRDFKGVIEFFLREFFGPEMRTRLRPSYFPFTEPSAEVDGSCIFCSGKGCRVCKQTGWIELFGAGMVDPAVYGFVGYDPDQYSGFAFGIGVERFAMLKYGVDDIQFFFQNDVRFLQQFG